MNDSNKLTICTLAVLDFHALHTGHFIKCLVEKVLKEFNISKQHLLAVVTDNAANMQVATHAHVMRCAVHTLQLAIHDGLKEKHLQNLISKIRQIVLVARTPKIDEF